MDRRRQRSRSIGGPGSSVPGPDAGGGDGCIPAALGVVFKNSARPGRFDPSALPEPPRRSPEPGLGCGRIARPGLLSAAVIETGHCLTGNAARTADGGRCSRRPIPAPPMDWTWCRPAVLSSILDRSPHQAKGFTPVGQGLSGPRHPPPGCPASTMQIRSSFLPRWRNEFLS